MQKIQIKARRTSSSLLRSCLLFLDERSRSLSRLLTKNIPTFHKMKRNGTIDGVRQIRSYPPFCRPFGPYNIWLFPNLRLKGVAHHYLMFDRVAVLSRQHQPPSRVQERQRCRIILNPHYDVHESLAGITYLESGNGEELADSGVYAFEELVRRDGGVAVDCSNEEVDSELRLVAGLMTHHFVLSHGRITKFDIDCL